MARKLDADLTEELSPKAESCAKHIGFTLDFVCKRCGRSVCSVCVVSEHSGHDIGCVKTQREEITELECVKTQREEITEQRRYLEERKVNVRRMIEDCEEMLEKVHENTEEELLSIEQERDRRRSSVEVARKDFERRVKGITNSLEMEENRIYALEYDSAEVALPAHGGKNILDNIQEEMRKCISSKIPRVKTYKDLKDKFKRMYSANRFSSSSTFTTEEFESTSVSFGTATFQSDDRLTTTSGPQPVLVHRSHEVLEVASSSRSMDTGPCTSPCEVFETAASQGSSSEEAQAIEGNSEDESGDADIEDLEADMDTDSNSDCEGEGAVGGLVFKERGERQTPIKGSETHSGRDEDVVLSDLALQLLPENTTPLGLRLGVSNIVIQHILHNNPRNIGNAIFQVLQEWKKTLSVEVLTEDHFKTLDQCLREIKNEDAADWLIERLQKSAGQPLQPPSSDQLMEPSTSHLVPPSSSDIQ